MRMCCISLLLGWVACFAPALSGEEAPRFHPGVMGAAPEHFLRDLQRLVRQNRPADAADVFQRLLEDHSRGMVRDEEDGVVSVAAWLSALAPDDRQRIEAEYRRQFDDAARQALREAQREPGTSAAFLAVARRYPLSSVAAEALVAAADRAVASGDCPAALTWFEEAQALCWTPDEPHARDIAVCRWLSDPAAAIRPEEAKLLPALAKQLDGHHGAVPFEARWFGQADRVGAAKYIPHASDGIVYIAAARHMLAMNQDGERVWEWASPDAWSPGFAADKPNHQGRGTVYRPAILSGVAGAQLLVVRQPRAGGVDDALRCFRAGDGKLLWATDQDPALDALSIASNPAVAGRYVYATAVEFAQDSGSLVLVAFDVMDGTLVFKSVLGNITDMRHGRRRVDGWDGFWDQSEPAIAGDALYVTPNVGVAFCIDRFDGTLRWARAYTPEQRGLFRRAAPAFEGAEFNGTPPPANETELLRYRGTPEVCGNVVVIAPQDTPQTLGLEARTGHVLWRMPGSTAPTLIGHAHNVAVFAGAGGVAGVNAENGGTLWGADPADHEAVAGPPALVRGVLLVPMSSGKVQMLSPLTGMPVQAMWKPASLRTLLASITGRKALAEAGVLNTLGAPKPE